MLRARTTLHRALSTLEVDELHCMGIRTRNAVDPVTQSWLTSSTLALSTLQSLPPRSLANWNQPWRSVDFESPVGRVRG